MANTNGSGTSLESRIREAPCSIRGAKDGPKYKDSILPLIFTRRLCDVFDDEPNRIADTVIEWKEEKLSHIVDHAERKTNDYTIFPSRSIHTGDTETCRPIPEIVAEPDAVETEARGTDKWLREILQQLEVTS